MNEIITLVVGEPYPFMLPSSEGAVADFLRDSFNRLLIAMPGITDQEARALKKGEMRGGFLFKNNAIHFIWQFTDPDSNKPILTLDSPFDAALIKDIKLYDINNSEDRLVIELHVVDSDTKRIKGLRAVTMPGELTRSFLMAVQEQLSSVQASNAQTMAWMEYQPVDLIHHAKMFVLGD